LRSGALAQVESIGATFGQSFFQSQLMGQGQTPQEKDQAGGDSSQPKPEKSWWEQIQGKFHFALAQMYASRVHKGSYDDEIAKENLPIPPDEVEKTMLIFDEKGYSPQLRWFVQDDLEAHPPGTDPMAVSPEIYVTQITIPHFGTAYVYDGVVYETPEAVARSQGWHKFDNWEDSFEGYAVRHAREYYRSLELHKNDLKI
jgi:hypothetical protein